MWFLGRPNTLLMVVRGGYFTEGKNMNHLTTLLDRVASQLESLEFRKLASELDVISNTLEAQAAGPNQSHKDMLIAEVVKKIKALSEAGVNTGSTDLHHAAFENWKKELTEAIEARHAATSDPKHEDFEKWHGPRPVAEPKPGEAEPKPGEAEPKPGEAEPKPGEAEPKPGEAEPKEPQVLAPGEVPRGYGESGESGVNPSAGTGSPYNRHQLETPSSGRHAPGSRRQEPGSPYGQHELETPMSGHRGPGSSGGAGSGPGGGTDPSGRGVPESGEEIESKPGERVDYKIDPENPVSLVIECLNPPRTIILELGKENSLVVVGPGNLPMMPSADPGKPYGLSYGDRPKVTSKSVVLTSGGKFDLADLLQDPGKSPAYEALKGLTVFSLALKGRNSQNRTVIKEIKLGGRDQFVYKRASMGREAIFGLGNKNKVHDKHSEAVEGFLSLLKTLEQDGVITGDRRRQVSMALSSTHEANRNYVELLLTLGLPEKPVVTVSLQNKGGRYYFTIRSASKPGKGPGKGEPEYLYHAMHSTYNETCGEFKKGTLLQTNGQVVGFSLDDRVHTIGYNGKIEPTDKDTAYLEGAKIIKMELRTHRGEVDEVDSFTLGDEMSPVKRKTDGTGPEEVAENKARRRCASILDNIANELEALGLRKLAFDIDTVANALGEERKR